MEHQGARPKGTRAQGDQPTSQPMRATRQGEIRRNPSTDQLKARRSNQRKVALPQGHVSCDSCGKSGPPVLGEGTASNCGSCGSYNISHSIPVGEHGDAASYAKPTKMTGAKTATTLNTDAWRLNPGDAIRHPSGRTMKVQRVRQHETSAHHVYVDTDGGTTLSKRTDRYEVVPHNSQQQSSPGYGTPGGNTNKMPGNPQGSGGNNQAPGKTKCPSCGGNGTLRRQGDHYTCSKCGYQESFGGAGGKGNAGQAFTDAPRQIQTGSSYSTVNSSGLSAIARRARAVLAQEENS